MMLIDGRSQPSFKSQELGLSGFSQSLSSELPLVVPLAISNLALGRLGECIALGEGRVWS